MSEQNFDQLLSGAVDSVLEIMFFSMPLGPATPETAPSVLEASVVFHGNPSGTLGVCLSAASARSLAAGFLGEDEEALTGSQPSEVVCELANMLCGSLVSKLESESSFHLDTPQLLPAAASPNPVAAQSFELLDGILTVTLCLEAAA